MGLGLMHCSKAWLVYSACTNSMYAGTSVTFNETRTLFPAKAINQLIYGYYYNAPPNCTSDSCWGSYKGNDVSDPGRGDNYDISAPGGGYSDGSDPGWGSPSSGPLPAGEWQPFPNARKHKGKSQPFGDKVPLLSETPKDWCDCQSMTIKNATDEQLAEYLISYLLEFTLPQNFYPLDKGQWTISCRKWVADSGTLYTVGVSGIGVEVRFL
eukprot:1560233-Rhodomonas_salina.1